MSPWSKRALIGIGWLAGIGLAAYGLWWTRDFLQKDAMSAYRQRSVDDVDKPVVTAEDIRMTHYEGDKLILEAEIGRFTSTSGRQILRGEAIQGGKLYRDGKVELEFDARLATWNAVRRTLDLEGAIRAKNQNLDLKTTKMTFDEANGRMFVDVPVKGKFYGGSIETKSMVYNLRQEKGRLMAVSWQGEAKAPTKEDAPPTQWNFNSKIITQLNKDEWRIDQFDATDKEIAIKSDSAVWNRKTDVTVAVGNVRYYSSEANMICDKVTVFRKERRVILEGKVSMLIKPEKDATLKVEELQRIKAISPEEVKPAKTKPTPQQREEVRSTDNRRKYPVRVLAEKVEYWYGRGERRALIDGKPQARQELSEGQWRMIWCHQATWNGETDLLTLLSEENKRTVRLRTSTDDDITARSAEISTAEDDERFSAVEPSGTVYGDEGEDEIPRPESEKKPPPGSA